MKAKAEVFSSGGGTQSCAIAALIIMGRLPKPDFSVIVDTGYERLSTWLYHEKYIVPGLASVGVEIHRVKREEWAANWANGIFSPTGGSLLLPVFSNQSGEVGKMGNFCSKAWKTEVVARWIRVANGVPTKEQRRWIGFSLDEYTRALKMMKTVDFKEGRIRFPLIDDIPLRRPQSIKLVMDDMGWPEPPRSNCSLCPNQTDAEWLDLKTNYPEEFSEACAKEREVQATDPSAWFHKSCIPLGEVNFNPSSTESRACDSGACFI